MLSEPGQVQWAFDQDAWVTGLNYSQLPLELSRNLYIAVRACVIHQARLHYEIDGAREFVHSESGIRTLKSEFDRIANHNSHHLAQIEQALRGTSTLNETRIVQRSQPYQRLVRGGPGSNVAASRRITCFAFPIAATDFAL